MSTAPGTPSPGDTLLCDLVRTNNGSVRLRNALAAAAGSGCLPFETVAEYLSSPAPTAVLRRAVRHFGFRTAQELDRMVRECARAPLAGDGELPEPAEVQVQLQEMMADLEFVNLRSALRHVPPGTRLERVLASPAGERSCWAAIDGPDLLRAEVLRVGSAGAGTADELVHELRLFVSHRIREAGLGACMHDALMRDMFDGPDGPSWRAEGPADREAQDVCGVVRAVLGDATCASAFENVVISVRLARVLRARGVGDRPLAEALIDRAPFGCVLARVPAVGRKTILEFWDVCWRTLAIALARAEVDADGRAAIAATLGAEPALLDARPEDLAELGLLVASDGDAPPIAIPTDLDGLLDFLLARIRPQDSPVVRRRFGLDGPSETLEEIGVGSGVTRERIRQLEKRGLGDLRTLARRVGLRQALDSDAARAWDALADGDDLVTDQEFAAFRRSVPGAVQLALEILGLDLSTWLSEVSRRYAHGWLAAHRDPAAVDEVISVLDASGESLLLPRALHELGLPGSRLDMEAALLVGRGHRTLHGYLVEGRTGTRRRRALVAHAVLARTPGPVPLVDLLRAYHLAAPADPCSTRDLTIVMSDAPHLFLEVSEGRWAAIGGGGEIPPGGRPRETDAPEDIAAEPDLTVAAAIRDELARTGPQALAALMDNPKRYLPRDRSHNSVQPTLITRPDLFARILPGVYSLWSQVPSRDEVISGDVPYLLDRQQARMFAMARRAQEPWGTFALWSPEAEYRLCRWAVREGANELTRSLLAMASVELWPVDAAEKAAWRDRAQADGRYDLVGTVRQNVFGVRPELDRVLAALVDLAASGRTSWMTLNRVDGRHVASQVGCSLLATLLLCGAIHPADPSAESGWQLQHAASYERIDEFRSALEAELHRSGRLDWTSDAGRMVASRVMGGADAAAAWLPFNRFSELFRFEALEPAAPVTIDEDRVGEAGRALLAERRMTDLLDWLGGQ
jgi:hypothetical protein